MDLLQWIGLGIATLAGGFTALARIYRFGPFLDKIEPMPSTDRIPEDTDFVPASPPPVIAPDAPKLPPSAPQLPETANSTLLWETPKQAWHSVRVLCDEMGLTYDQKNEICYTINGESEFYIKAIGKPNKNGTRDYGICQYNDGVNAKGIPFWIGKGATFKDVDEVLNNPEKCVRVMIQTYKAGHIGWWYGHIGYSHPVPKTHPMWKLA